MTFLQSAILGIVQGLTEFIPVSSTGHLLITRKILGLDLVGTLSFDAIIQLATGIALVCYFWKDILGLIIALVSFLRRQESISDSTKKYQKLILPLIIGTIPAIILGLFLEKYMDTYFRGTHIVAVALMLGAILFYFAEKFSRETSKSLSPLNGVPNRSERFSEVSLKTGLFIGFFQCLALVPGFSRSGATISGGLFNKLNRESAARFSFLLSIPIILGSGLKKVFELSLGGELASVESSLIIASLFAFITGLLAIHFLLKFLKNHSLNWFGAYRVLLAIIILIWL
jgi:undecaprenyl-diphosphatase